MQFRPVPTTSGGGLLEQAPAASGFEGFRLQDVALFVSFGDASVAKQQARTVGFWAFTNVRLRMDLAGTAIPREFAFNILLQNCV